MKQRLRGPWSQVAAAVLSAAMLLLITSAASAQLVMDVNGLRGGRYVASAGAISSAPTAVVGAGYAYTEGVLNDSDTHHRVFSDLAAGYAPWRYLQLSLGFDARYDAHRGDAGSDRGISLGTQVVTRHSFHVSPTLSLAARTKVRFPPATRGGLGLRAASPELGAVASYALPRNAELSLDVGYRIDRSRHSVDGLALLSRADVLGASISKYDAALIGALFAMPIGPVTASAEWSWDVAVGAGAPGPAASPMRARVAAQTRLAQRFVPGLEIGVSPSSRPSLDRLARIEPRFWFAVTLGFVIEPMPPPPVMVATTLPAATNVEQEPARLEVRVVDPAGAPVAGASVALEGEPVATTGIDGLANLTLAPAGGGKMSVSASGFEPQEVTAERGPGEHQLTVTLPRTLREGEIKGTVRSLRGGKPLRARVVVEPLSLSVETDATGAFVVPVPPGVYQLQIAAPGHEPQVRPATVERFGVTIVVVDLRVDRR